MRILVTGSREWIDYDAVANALSRAVSEEAIRRNDLGPTHWVTVIHGACPSGADALADAFAAGACRWTVERYPADWSQGRRAGPERNARMVALGADLCLAFIGPCTSARCIRTDVHASHGATGCALLAERAGIPVRRFYAPELAPTAPEAS